MRLSAVARSLGAQTFASGSDVEVSGSRVCAGDRISDLLNDAADCVVLVTNLTGSQLVRVAELMDVPAVCLVSGQLPDAATIEAAREHRRWLMVSPLGLFETCGRLYEVLREADH